MVTFIAIIVVIGAVVIGRAATREPIASSSVNMKQVALVEAKTFRDDLTVVSADGIVESASQADVKSQVSAPIARVNVSVGDYVSMGQVLVEFQNADIRAQLDQARASLTLVKGQNSSGTGDSATQSAVNEIRTQYIKVDDAVRNQVGQFLYTSNSSQVQLQQGLRDWRLADNLSSAWSDSMNAFTAWKKAIDTLSNASTKVEIESALKVSESSLATISKLLDVAALAIIDRNQSAQGEDIAIINGWRPVVLGARSTVSASISALTTSGSSLSNNVAQVSVAEAGVKGLEAQLAKTVITAPISGTIAALPLRTGEFASMGQLITTVIGSGGLQLKVYASSEDVERIKIGATVLIDGLPSGTIASIAPSVNPLNKKVEVKVTVPASARSNFVVGQSVQAKIIAATIVSTPANRTASYILPIQNVKIIPGAAYVYTVDADSKIVRHEVTLGEVKGDFVEVKTGLTDDMKIVSPVYELEEGQSVRTE